MTILGIDEVGRGALAGPVVLGGVRITDNFPLLCYHLEPDSWYKDNLEFKIVRDSKKLSEMKREKVLKAVDASGIDYSILFCSSELIDEFGIGVCLSHMVCVLVNILPAERIVIDGKIKILEEFSEYLLERLLSENSLENTMTLKPTLIENQNSNYILVERENKADDKYLSIALASTISKVKRDQLMKKLSQDYPEYGWWQNKGYGTEKHRIAIRSNPNNVYLRQTFLSKILKNSPV